MEKARKPMSKGIKTLIIIGIALGGLILLCCAVLLFAFINHKSYKVRNIESYVDNDSGLVVAVGKGLYDPSGNELILQGVNVGGMFVTEGWLEPYAIHDMEKGSDGYYQYEELSQEQFLEGFKSNPNLTDEERAQLMEIFYDNWFTEDDAKRVKALGMNCLRVPFYYRDILNEDENGDFSLKSEAEAFKYLDKIVGYAEKYNLYVVLDLHGCPGSQSGYEHSGSIDYNKYDKNTIHFWYNEKYVDAVVDLWSFVSKHYMTNPTVAMYDIINEPRSKAFKTDKTVWKVYDKIYDAIRGNGDNHNICMEGCWDFSTLPNPKKYEWSNVTYSYHFYNWGYPKISNTLFYMYQDLSNVFRNYDVPVYIGEFTFFNYPEAWKTGLDLFKERHYSWTLWTYKKTVEGWWSDTWGLYNLHSYNDKDAWVKVNIQTATYDEIKECFEATNTNNDEYVKNSEFKDSEGTLINFIRDYLSNNK